MTNEVRMVNLTEYYAAMTAFWEWAASPECSLTAQQYNELRRRLPMIGNYTTDAEV